MKSNFPIVGILVLTFLNSERDGSLSYRLVILEFWIGRPAIKQNFPDPKPYIK